ncbi:DoxX family protein [Candidatus Gracilibacteria bacterium]|nr:DoxX family protein [Candidatus Gracilibacteria bacterium]
MRKCFIEAPWMHNLGLLLARLVLGAVFITAGYMKIGNIEMVTGMLSGMSFPAPTFFAYLLALVELVGGVAVVLGLWTRFFSFLLAVTMVIAWFTAHLGDFEGGKMAMSMFGLSMALVAAGAGKWRILSKECPC